MRQTALTLIAQVKDDNLEPLRRALRENEAALMAALRRGGTVRYARRVILEPSTGFKAALAFESNFDGPVNAHVQALVRELGPCSTPSTRTARTTPPAAGPRTCSTSAARGRRSTRGRPAAPSPRSPRSTRTGSGSS